MKDLTTTWLAPAIIAAVIAALVSLLIWAGTGWRENRRRRREMFAEAYAAYTAYREFPYVVRRRRHDQPAEERQRISDAIRAVQERINFFVAWTMLESPEVGAAYRRLIESTRRIAGAEITKAWQATPITADDQVPMGTTIDLSALDEPERALRVTLRRHVRPWWPRLKVWVLRHQEGEN